MLEGYEAEQAALNNEVIGLEDWVATSLLPQSAQTTKPENSPCRSALVMRRLCWRSSCTLSLGPSRIARILEADEVLTVKALYAQQKGKPLPERPCHWIRTS